MKFWHQGKNRPNDKVLKIINKDLKNIAEKKAKEYNKYAHSTQTVDR